MKSRSEARSRSAPLVVRLPQPLERERDLRMFVRELRIIRDVRRDKRVAAAGSRAALEVDDPSGCRYENAVFVLRFVFEVRGQHAGIGVEAFGTEHVAQASPIVI